MTTTTMPILVEPLTPATMPPPPRPAPSRWPIAMLGVAFDAVTMDEALARIAEMVASRQPHYVVTPNVDFLVQARRDAELRRILLEAHLVLCDGTPLVWTSRWLGNPLPERVAGADLVPRLIALAAEKNYRLFLLGGSPEANAQAAARLRSQHPSLPLVGHYSPPFRPLHEMEHDDIARRIRSAQPDILLVSFGCPKQEKWIAMHYRTLGVPVCLGVGAVIDFLAGRVSRAPRWMQRAGAEWLYRLVQEPRRLFRRYAEDLRYFGGAVLMQCWQLRWRARGVVRGWVVWAHPAGPHALHVHAAGRLDRQAIADAGGVWEHFGASSHNWLLDLAAVQFIDSTGVAFLLKLRRQLHESGHQLTLLAPSQAVQSAFADMQLTDYFTIAEFAPSAGSRDDAEKRVA